MDNPIDETFNRFRQCPNDLTVNDDFESRVFAKIRKKKIQRKVTASVAMVVVLFGVLFVAGGMIFNEPDKVDPGFSSLARQMSSAEWASQVQEEVPVVEEVIFASSDGNSNYAVENVAYNEDSQSF